MPTPIKFFLWLKLKSYRKPADCLEKQTRYFTLECRDKDGRCHLVNWNELSCHLNLGGIEEEVLEDGTILVSQIASGILKRGEKGTYP